MERGTYRSPDAVTSASSSKNIGCGLLGCLGGLLTGLIGGAIFLAVVSLVQALTSASPTLLPAPPDQSDIRITVDEAFLNRFIEPPPGGTTQIDLLPDNKMTVTTEGSLPLLAVPVEIVALFEVEARGETMVVNLLDTQVTGIELPPEMNDLFGADIALVNQNLSQAVDQISDTLGVPVLVTDLSTTDTELILELREFPGGVN